MKMETDKGPFGLGRNQRGGWFMPVVYLHGTEMCMAIFCY